MTNELKTTIDLLLLNLKHVQQDQKAGYIQALQDIITFPHIEEDPEALKYKEIIFKLDMQK